MKIISNHTARLRTRAVLLTFMLTLLGCGPSKKLELIPVKGKVTFNNSNLAGGQITFNPLKRANGRPHRSAIGAIDSSGNYVLTTVRYNDGIQPGEYAVSVVCYVPGASSPDADSEPPLLTPKKYVRADTTPLRAVIPENTSSEMTFNFTLEDK